MFRELPALVAATLLGAMPLSAAQFNVTNASDSGPGTLRQALVDASATPGPDDVVVQAEIANITLASELSWSTGGAANGVTIEGNGVRVNFDKAPRGFVDDGGHGVTIRNMEITGVGGSIADDAAPILSQGGPIVVDHCEIFGNHVTTTDGDVGGAILSEGGPVTITTCTIRNNTATGTSDGGTVLSEGSSITVSDSLIEHNIVVAVFGAGGGLESEGGAVTVTNSTINCNRASAGTNQDAAGGLLSEGGSVTVGGSTFIGNVGRASGTGHVGGAIVSNGPEPVVSETTINDDTGSCGDEIESYFLPKRVNVAINQKSAVKSVLSASGFIDLGPGVVDLSGSATFDVGGFHFTAPSLAVRRGTFTFEAPGAKLTITPNRFGSSRAIFRLRIVSDLTGKIDPAGQLDLHFTNSAVDAVAAVKLTRGRYRIQKVRGALVAPNVYVASAKATLKGPGKDALTTFVGLASGGTTPAAAPDLTLSFGESFLATIPGTSFTKTGDRFTFKGNSAGITRVVLDYARETMIIFGKKLDLGDFATGGNRVRVSVALGDDQRAVAIRMSRKGSVMKY